LQSSLSLRERVRVRVRGFRCKRLFALTPALSRRERENARRKRRGEIF